MKELFVPALGMAMEECLLVEWLVESGAEVREGDAVAVIETDKATMELEAPGDGRLGPHLVAAGATVPVGTTISHILEGEEQVPDGPPVEQHPASEVDPVASAIGIPVPPAPVTPSETTEARSEPGHEPTAGVGEGDTPGRPHRLSPRARRLAAEGASAEPRGGPVSHEAVDRHRAAVAESVSESWRTIPHFGVTSQVWAEVLLSSVSAARAQEPRVTATDLILRAFAHALYEEGASGGGSIGLAVATDRGVVIPVIPDAGTLSLEDLVEARHDAVARARAGKMRAVDGSAPGFTLSNLGVNDVEHFTGIIPVHQAGLLAVGRAKQRPVVVEGRLAAVATMFATLNVDHRVYDGAHAGAILDAFGRILNDQSRLLRR